jgi:hypothetical protein
VWEKLEEDWKLAADRMTGKKRGKAGGLLKNERGSVSGRG